MPILVIRNLWAIKMHHWGPKELVVGAGYRLNKEKTILLRGMPPQFLTDKEETKKKLKAYLKRHDAKTV